ncbi:ATPase [Enterococcus saigonensis]|uniref:ATPase n=1 Tax=Enterococcus saigonensis TaxID=1805431 RepID=A0A679IJ25_9ENTE|nr:P-loop NTPase fold protein [Enterococcus saigonensis]BCA85196.1 ATPase [Enterococcus saigonensis]
MWKDSETEIDYLNFGHLTNLLTNLIDNDKLLPATIGVYGDWGSGKSSLIKMAIRNLNDQNDQEKIVTLNFNGWMFEGYEDAKTVLLESILDTIEKNATLTSKGKQVLKGLFRSVDKLKLMSKGIKYSVDLINTGGIGIIVDQVASKFKEITGEDIPESQIEKTVNSIREELNLTELREDLKLFQENFAELLEDSKIDKLVIFIDELDRCSPDTIIETLEAMRLFVFTGNTIFIIGADERHISYSVERKFSEIKGNQIDIGKEYLEKLVQYPIKIPQLDSNEVEFYVFCLLLEDTFDIGKSMSIFDTINKKRRNNILDFTLSNAISEFSEEDYYNVLSGIYSTAQQLAGLLAVGLNGNPRQCKRFLNSMRMREIMAKSYGIELNRNVLTKIMLVEYFKPAAYEQITILAGKSSNGIVNEFSFLENGVGKEDENALMTFFQDDWSEKWLKINPSLNDKDLRGYLFFTRDSLRNPVKLSSLNLSKDAQKTLQMLTSGGSATLEAAVKSKDQLSLFDRVEISKILSSDIKINNGKYNFSQFKSFFIWVTSNIDILDETIFFLNSLDGEKINIGAGPVIFQYLLESHPDNRVIKIIQSWRNKNGELDKAIEKSEVK